MTSLKEVKSGNYLVLSLDLLQQSLSCYLNSDSVYYFLFGYMWCCVCQCALCDFMHVYELPADSVWCCSHGCNSAWEFFWLFFHHHLARRFHHWKTCSKQVLQSCMSPMSSLPQLFPTWVLTGTFQLQQMTKLVLGRKCCLGTSRNWGQLFITASNLTNKENGKKRKHKSSTWILLFIEIKLQVIVFVPKIIYLK